MLRIFQSILGSPGDQARPALPRTPLQALRASYRELRRLADQVDKHAALAPYPHVTRKLQLIAVEKRALGEEIRGKIQELGGRADETALPSKLGQNHWERVSQDIVDQRVLDSQLLGYAVALTDDAPDISEFLKGLVERQAPHMECFLDLVARADPQANQLS